MNPNLRGAIAEAAIAYEAVKCGIEVLRPASEHCRYDLVFGIGSRLLRVQCKSAARNGEVLVIRLVSSWHTPSGYVRSRYKAGEIDLVAAHCHELGRSSLFPVELVEGKTAIQLRLTPPLNGQRAAIHFAANFEFPGAIAQLGERLHGMQEVAGSSPASSTPEADDESIVVGAHVFRNQFGYYMERAAAGSEIVVTRRGRPTVRLVPHQPEQPA
jgi:prevent-host-death family protein